jgi:hypothetical protein
MSLNLGPALEIPYTLGYGAGGRHGWRAKNMKILLVCILIFILFMVAGHAGLALQTKLNDRHRTGETKGVIGQVSGLVSLLLALVLGTLIGVSWAYFSAQRTNLENFSAQVLRLDQALGQFGPETKPVRDKLKEGIEKAYTAIWGGGKIDPAMLTVEGPLQSALALADYLGTLQPKTDTQKAALATANTYAGMVEQSRLLISLQIASAPVSWILIAILVFWTASLFFAIGLYAESNSVVFAAITFGALSIAFAIFLILELGMPYTGLFKVSPAALEQTIQFIDK